MRKGTRRAERALAANRELAAGEAEARNANRGTVWHPGVVKPVRLDAMPVHAVALVRASRRGWVSRNSACPCGSGQRFKRCHGRQVAA